MKRKYYSDIDISSNFALDIVITLDTNPPAENSGIIVNAKQLYSLAQSYLEMYDNINKGRATYVEESRMLH